MLYVVAENLIAKYGWSKTLFPPVHVNGTIDADHTFFKRSEVTGKLVPRDGNTLILQLVVDGMKLQVRLHRFQMRPAQVAHMIYDLPSLRLLSLAARVRLAFRAVLRSAEHDANSQSPSSWL